MARSRNIKYGFFQSADLIELPPLTRILFAGLWCIADRAGRLEDRPKQIKVEVLPGDDCDVDLMLGSLHNSGFIQRYEVDRKKFIQIITFAKHQKPHAKEAPSTIPESHDSYLGPDEQQPRSLLGTAQVVASRADCGLLIPDSGLLIADCLENPLSAFEPESDPKIEPEPEKPEATPLELEIEEIGARIHARHPAARRCSLGEVRVQLRAIVRKLRYGEKIPALRSIDRQHGRWCESDDWRKDGGQYAKGLDNWLAPTKRRWENDPPEAVEVEQKQGKSPMQLLMEKVR